MPLTRKNYFASVAVIVWIQGQIFDEYWINQGVLQVPNPKKPGQFKKLTKLTEFLEFKGMDTDLINPPKPKRKNKTNDH